MQLFQAFHPKVMGILNVTPDSFADGGRYVNPELAVKHALKMVEEGADIIDLGGESTRPGALEVSLQEELQRTIPVIKAIRKQSNVLISIDTYKPEVMRAAISAGANMINDVFALQRPGALELAAELNVPVCLMHMQGIPASMQNAPHYKDVINDIYAFLEERIQICLQAGVRRENIIVDPGFGFGKTLQHNLRLMNNLEKLLALEYPIMVGMSRKSMIAKIIDEPADKRVFAGIALAVLATTKGAAIIRTHDVKPTLDAIKMTEAVINS